MTAILPDFARQPSVSVASGGGGGSVPTGTIIEDFAWNTPDSSFLPAYGQAVSRTTYSALFSKIGTAYGIGDGSTTFNLPKLKMEVTANYLLGTDVPVLVNGCAVTLPDNRILTITSSGCYLGTPGVGNSITWVNTGTSYPIAGIDTITPVVLNDGRVLCIGGGVSGTSNNSTYFCTISGNTISFAAGTVYPLAIRSMPTVQLSDGRILVVGGFTTGLVSNTYFGTISGNTITWAAGTAYPTVLADASLLISPDNNIIVFCGNDNSTRIAVRKGVISTNTITWTSLQDFVRRKDGAMILSLPNNDFIFTDGLASASDFSNRHYIRLAGFLNSGYPKSYQAEATLPIENPSGYIKSTVYCLGRLYSLRYAPNAVSFLSHKLIKI